MLRVFSLLLLMLFPSLAYSQGNVCFQTAAEDAVRLCEDDCNNCSAPVNRGDANVVSLWNNIPNVCYDSPATWPTDDWLTVWDKTGIPPLEQAPVIGSETGNQTWYIYVSGQTTQRAEYSNDIGRFEACVNGEPQPPVQRTFAPICYYTASEAPVRLCSTNNCDNCAGPSGRGTRGYLQQWPVMPFVCRKSANGNWYGAGSAPMPPYEFSQSPDAPLPAPGVAFDSDQGFYIYISGGNTARGDYTPDPAAFQKCVGLVPPN